VVGTDFDAAVLGRADERGLIDSAISHLPAAVAQANLVVFCTPVDCIAASALAAVSHCQLGALLTDVGSVKASIVRELQGKLPGHVSFIGSHPLAGSEKHGLENARADLFDGRLVVVTPGSSALQENETRIADFWRALGARVTFMSPEEHDRAVGLTSHLPHLLASALAAALPAEWAHLAASGFRDTTRLAAGSPDLWTSIFRTNREPVLAALALLEGKLASFRQSLTDDDAAEFNRLLAEGKVIRDSLHANK
jgi:prephenate dehydrogenase